MVHEILHARGLDVLDINKAQALVPDTCEVIVNHLGTAPIMVFRFPKEDTDIRPLSMPCQAFRLRRSGRFLM